MALASAAAAALVLAGCASPGRQAATVGTEGRSAWSGRLSLRIDSEPAQSFAALFELRGGPEQGELVLTSPIGSTLAQLQWSPGEAFLKNGNETRRYASVAALAEAATGAAIPIDALFGWLDGRQQAVPGWRADLGGTSSGRLQARRESPLPAADLRIVFERL
jgi:outer membrane lipoprotein LolB